MIHFHNICSLSRREKYPNTEVFLVRIFLYSDWIQKNTARNNSVFGLFSRSVCWTCCNWNWSVFVSLFQDEMNLLCVKFPYIASDYNFLWNLAQIKPPLLYRSDLWTVVLFFIFLSHSAWFIEAFFFWYVYTSFHQINFFPKW